MAKFLGLLGLLASLTFGATQYSGSAWYTTVATDGTKQTLINNIETALLHSGNGWTTVSGSGTTNLLMSSVATPAGLAVYCRFKDNGGTEIQVYMESTDGTLKPASYATTNGASLSVTVGITYELLASKYQFVLYSANSPTTAKQFVWVGVPYLNASLSANITRAGFLFGGNQGTSTNVVSTIAFTMSLGKNLAGTNSNPNVEVMVNSNWWETANASSVGPQNVAGFPRMLINGMVSDFNQTLSSATGYRWRTATPSIVTGDVFVAWGLTANTDEAMVNGQFYDCVFIGDSQPIDTTATFDSHDWRTPTNSNIGLASTYPRGGLWFATN